MMWEETFYKSAPKRSVLDHIEDEGRYDVESEPVYCDLDPILHLAQNNKKYYFVMVLLPPTEYIYLIRSDEVPDRDTIEEQIDDYIKHPVSEGRDWLDYIDLTDHRNFENARLITRLLNDGWSVDDIEEASKPAPKPQGKPISRFSIDDYA